MSSLIPNFPPIYAIDFDGTLCEDRFPDIGPPNITLINFCKQLKNVYGAKLILHTNRVNEQLEKAIKWCKQHELEFDAYNENLPEIIEYYGGDNRKITADYFIDDRMLPYIKLPFRTDENVISVTTHGSYEKDGTKVIDGAVDFYNQYDDESETSVKNYNQTVARACNQLTEALLENGLEIDLRLTVTKKKTAEN